MSRAVGSEFAAAGSIRGRNSHAPVLSDPGLFGPAGREQDSGPGTDFHAVRTGHISITPIQVDLTRYQALEKVASWVGGLSAALDQPA